MKVAELMSLIEKMIIFGEPARQPSPDASSKLSWTKGVTMQYLVVVEKGPSSYGAFVPDLPGCIAVGETENEVVSLIREAIQFHLEDLQTEGQPIPPSASKSTFVEVGFAA